MRIKLIIADPVARTDVARRAAAIPPNALAVGTTVEASPTRTGPQGVSSPYDLTLTEVAVLDAGMTAQDDGFAAVVIDDPADPALDALRSRLAIPVTAPTLGCLWLARLVGLPVGMVATESRAAAIRRRLLLEDVTDATAMVSSFPEGPADASGSQMPPQLLEAVDALVRSGAACIALCGPEADPWQSAVANHVDVPVFSATISALKLAEVLVALGLRQSGAAFREPSVIQDDLVRERLAGDGTMGRPTIVARDADDAASRRILDIVPHSDMDEESIARRAKVIAPGLLAEATQVMYTGTQTSPNRADSPYASFLMDVFCFERGLRAEEDGFDAVTIDSTTDSGIPGLRSRLRILVLGTGSATWALAAAISHHFSIVAMEAAWTYFYDKNLKLARLRDRLASVEVVGTPTDPFRLFEGKEAEMFARLEALGRAAIDDKGAEAIIMGSTTMHEAADHLAGRFEVPVLNPGRIALRTIEALLDLGLQQSRVESPLPMTTRDDIFA